MSLDPELIKLLRCPDTKEPLTYDEKNQELRSSKWAYPVKDGIPIMLTDEARKVPKALPKSKAPSKR